jgi:hypothetical protein
MARPQLDEIDDRDAGCCRDEAEEGSMVDMSWQAFGYRSNQKKYEVQFINKIQKFDGIEVFY